MALAPKAADSSSEQLYVFGGFRLLRGSQALHVPTRKVELLLAYLALFPGAHSREHLAGLFWGDAPDELARGSLRKALTALRQVLGNDALLADRLTAQLHPDKPVWIDAAAFESALSDRDAPEDSMGPALDLYRGDLLRDFCDDWIAPLREHYRLLFLEHALAAAQRMRTRSEYEKAIGFAQRALAVDPANERAHQHLMFCYMALGRRGEALQQYESCKRALLQELDVPPSPETTALYRWIRDGPPQQAAPEALVTNLPFPLSSFVGREEQTAQVKTWLTDSARLGSEQARQVRLLTLTGPGGSGKTRLAIHTAADLIDSFPDGVWWVELAGLNDGGLVVHAVARTLGARESPDTPQIDTLVAFLRDRRLLLVIDNCEHLVEACALLVDTLLNHCPGLAILATSRQALGLLDERTLPTPPLAVPRYTHWTQVQSLLNFEGIRLFVQRAEAANPRFALTSDNAAAVRQICARLDGIPLAIELAAQWMRTLSAAELASRLDDRFALLASGNRAAPPRHQTLRGVIDWSHNLLEETERTAFRRLAVFAGGWTLEAGEDVIALGAEASGDGRPALDVINSLVNQSLVIGEQPQGRSRLQMMETIREYAHEKLRAAGEENAAHSTHLDHFIRLAEAAEAGLRGPRQLHWLERLDLELDNVRAALDWSLAHDPQRGLRLASALGWYWNLRGHWHEGPLWLERLLTAPGSLDPSPARARALLAAALLMFWGSNDHGQARDQLDEAIGIFRGSISSTWDLGYALTLLGLIRLQLGDRPGSQLALEEARAIGESLGEPGKWVCAWAWMGLGDLADTARETMDCLQRSADLFRELEDKAQLPVVLARLAWLHLWQGNYEAAERFTQESIALTEEIGDIMGAAWMQKLSGDLALAQGNGTQAQEHFQAALEGFRKLGSKMGMAEALSDLGGIHRASGRLDDARLEWTEALALFDEIDQQTRCRQIREWLEELAVFSR